MQKKRIQISISDSGIAKINQVRGEITLATWIVASAVLAAEAIIEAKQRQAG